MKIKNLLNHSILSLAVLSSLTVMAQETRKIQPCNTYAAMEDVFAKDPSAKARYEASQAKMYQEYLDYNASKLANKTASGPVYTVPVVFHILHQGGPENISDQVIINALSYINKDYARANTDANSTSPPFDASYIDSQIQIMLAHKDPNGNCTNGIVHHQTPLTNWNQANNATNYIYTWDPTKYMNVYIVADIIPTGTVTGNGIIVGYTFKPGTWPTGASQDAIVYRYDFLQNGTDPRSLTHEMGHWFNLSHTWGNTNNPGVACGDDGITDTPVTLGEFGNCPASNVATCTQTNAAMNGLNNVENIMNYSGCPKNFTTLQTNTMRAALASSTSGRSNVVSAANLIAADVNGTGICAPVSDFMSTAAGDYTVCSGQTIVTFKDYSYNAAVTSWSWAASSSATITTPTASTTNIYFPTVGTTTVSLTVTNGQGSNTSSRNVTVIDGLATETVGFVESFEASSLPPNWSIQNWSGGTTWAQTSSAASDGAFSMIINGNLNTSLAEDVLVSPVMDFENNANCVLTFDYAYKRKTTSWNDIFKVQLSNDCGGSWKDVYAPSAAVMATNSGGVGTGNFIPTASQWFTQDVSSHPNYFSFSSSPSVLCRFYFQEANGGFGNNIYVDKVNLITPSGINEITKHIKLNLYPNPTNGSSSLNFVLSDAANVKVTVMDIAGKIVSPEKVYDFGSGNHSVTINENAQLNKGIYIVNLEYNGTKLAKKLVVE